MGRWSIDWPIYVSPVSFESRLTPFTLTDTVTGLEPTKTVVDVLTVLGGIVAYLLVARYYPEQERAPSTVIPMLTVLWLHVRDSDS